MSILCDGLHKTVIEGSIYPGPLIRYEIAYETESYYGKPVNIQKQYPAEHPESQNPLALGDSHKHNMFEQLHKLLSGELKLTPTREILTDRPKR